MVSLLLICFGVASEFLWQDVFQFPIIRTGSLSAAVLH